MINVKDHKTGYLFDPWEFLVKKRRKLMDKSWAGLFREKILCELPGGEFAELFSDEYGRPTKELYAVLGALILQQMLNLPDDETIERFAFNLQWHYALDKVRKALRPSSDVFSTGKSRFLSKISHVTNRLGLIYSCYKKYLHIGKLDYDIEPLLAI